jgi:hypothetical protein
MFIAAAKKNYVRRSEERNSSQGLIEHELPLLRTVIHGLSVQQTINISPLTR